jgi:hypothetical protein
MFPNIDRLLRRTEAATYITDTYGIPCSPKTLAKLACVSSDGPPFRLAGRFPLFPGNHGRYRLETPVTVIEGGAS